MRKMHLQQCIDNQCYHLSDISFKTIKKTACVMQETLKNECFVFTFETRAAVLPHPVLKNERLIQV